MARNGRVFLPPGTGCYHYDFTLHGKRYRASTGYRDRRDALRVLREKMHLAGAGHPLEFEREPLSVACAMVLADQRARGRRSIDNTKRKLGHVERIIGKCPVGKVNEQTLTSYANMRQDEGAAAASINQELVYISRAFELARRAGLVLRKPHIPYMKGAKVRMGTWSREELKAFGEALPDHVRPVFQFLWLTGWRRGEALGLQWSQIDPSTGWVYLDPNRVKGGELRGFPYRMHPALEYVIDQQRESVRAVQLESARIVTHVFHHRRGGWRGRPLSVNAFRKAWLAAREATGITKLPHDLRRTFAREAAKFLPPELIMRIAGWKTRSVFERYNIVHEVDIMEAVTNLHNKRPAGDIVPFPDPPEE